MGALVWLVLFIAANCALNLLTSGKIATSGIDFVLPAIILVAHSKGPAWGVVAASLIISAHFFTAPDKIHRLPFALLTGVITAVVVGGVTAPLQTAVKIGIITYHAFSFAAVMLFYRSMGMRYFLFMVLNILFSAWVLSFFY